MTSHPNIRPLERSDIVGWRRLWSAYLEFYETSVPEDVYTTTFDRLLADDPWMPSAFVAEATEADGSVRLVGLVHFLFHTHCWRIERACYLQDLFVDPDMRGHHIGEHLIERVAEHAKRSDNASVYWLTQDSNTTARHLYDRIATVTPFIKYQKELTGRAE